MAPTWRLSKTIMNCRSFLNSLGAPKLKTGFVAGLFSAVVGAVAQLTFASVAMLSPQIALAQSVRGLPDFADLVEKAGPAVVNIRTTSRARANAQTGSGPNSGGPRMPEGMDENDPFFEFFKRFFPPRGPNTPNTPGQPNTPAPQGRGEEVPRGVGSGFIVSSDGYLLTNHHVVDGADEIYVTLTDKRELKAKLIGSDKRTDVAVVKVEGSGFPTLKFGDPNRLRVGEWVVAIGSPFGLENTVTAGIVSAKGRDTGDFLPFIQTDVAVNPGNSGGPLINMLGEVVGINSQIYSRTGGFQGISFAIPIDEAQRVSDQLRSSGRVVRGRIGVGIAEVTKDVAEPLGLPRAAGALVRNVESGGPADKAGVEVGDIIQKFDGKAIEKSSDLPRIVGNTKPGARASLSVWRKGAAKELSVTVAELEADKTAAAKPAAAPTPPAPTPSVAMNVFGLSVSDLNDERKAQLKVKNGVLVDSAVETAARAGIRQGDIVLGLNNLDVTSAKQFNDLVGKLDKAKSHVLLVRRGDSAQFVPLRPLSP
jgi:serine protease Do